VSKRLSGRNFRRLILSSVAGVGMLAAAGAANAQDAQDPQDPPEDAVDVGEIIVTGTRLRLPNDTQPNPVVSVTAETIQYSGVTNVTDLLTDFPALANSFNSVDSADTGGQAAAGLNLLNLRNLGTQRTLVLVNGRRHVASSPGSASVDTNTIPVGLIERLDIQTGGASAVYGADAVSGAVNFILRERFTGFDVRAQAGATEDGGGESYFISGLFGRDFMDGRLNATFAVEYAQDEAISAFDRSYTRPGEREVLVQNPNDFADDPNVPDRVFFRDVRYPDTSRGGSVYTDLDFGDSYFGFDFEGAGPVWRDGTPTGGFPVIGGSGTLLDEFVDDLTPSQDRYTLNTTGRFELTPNADLFWEGKFTRIKTGFTAQPTFDFGYGPDNAYLFLGLWTGIDNPFMPASIRDDAINNPDGLGNPGNAALLGVDPGVFFQRDNFDFGYTGRDITRDTWRGVVGVDGEFSNGWSYEVALTHGVTETESIYLNNRLNDRFLAAIDVVDGPGGPVCRSNLDPASYLNNPNVDPRVGARTFTPGANSGCQPLNIFGDGSPSAEALDWIHIDSTNFDEIEQTVLGAFISGDTERFFNLPAGPISFVVGAEYRKESSESTASDIERLAQSVADERPPGDSPLPYDVSWSGAGRDSGGSFDVKELYGELSLPLLADLPFAEELRLDAAYRYSDYETAGGVDTWSLGLRYRPTDWLLLRGTRARAVRAPNIGELFLPQVQTFALLTDPCDRDNVNLGTSNRAANCAAALTAAGVADPANFENTNSGSVQGLVGGNPDLDVEEADTVTYGFSITPRDWIKGLTISVDYYDIELSNAIQTFAAQTIVDQCYDLPAGNQFCDLISRRSQPGPGQGFIDFFQQFAVNVASYKTEGYDFTVRYFLDPADFGIEADIGTFGLSLAGTKLEELAFTELDTPVNQLGFPAAPEWIVATDVTWTWRDFVVNYGYSFYDETFRVDPQALIAEPDFVEPEYRMFSARHRHDIQARWNMNDDLTIYGGINNFTNQEPDRGSFQTPIGPQGRFFYVGATVRWGQ
jgi:iron complex outermembrane recepter protein